MCDLYGVFLSSRRRHTICALGTGVQTCALPISSFMEVSYLLLNGELPTAAELEKFTYTISRHTMVHEQLATFFRGFRRDAHPMAILCDIVGALSAFYHDSTEIHDPYQRIIATPPKRHTVGEEKEGTKGV